MVAYYNEIDPFAAQWLRNLIAAGHIAPGEVDERSIVEVDHRDLRGFDQCHFFAGIGVWSHALRLAGWTDDRPVWTGSCPCQPFSAAGAGKEFADERHLWPAWFELIRLCRPVAVFGEQVASRDALAWLDHVCADLEAEGYAVGAVDTCAAGFGAPHIRQRLYWVADAECRAAERHGYELGSAAGRVQDEPQQRQRLRDDSWNGIDSRAVADSTNPDGRSGERRTETRVRADGERRRGFASGGADRLVGNAIDARPQGFERPGDVGLHGGPGAHGSTAMAGFWRDAEWLPCRDGKARPTEPGIKQMASGIAESLGRLLPGQIAEAEAEINEAASRYKADAGQALQYVWLSLAAEAMDQRGIGRLQGIWQAPILLAFMRQLADQGWTFAQSIPRAGEETEEAVLRGMRVGLPSPRPSHQRGLDEQPTGELADLVRVLPSILARHAQEAWGSAFDRNAEATFPLVANARSRVGRLRAYGNSIVAPQAAEFIRAFIDQ